ncbi:MAG TPA: TlpA family protein disulfide reductase [Gemmatimonas aurantiaca]|uniref:TlpA family protein disulfide reductase n=1 Tax=Gemmatimonas aurantiaca TaxID=173480 RepID=A0A3D4V9S5_9BACT|nr:TlpA disulfide reductase family protein [Gemmatimonas aurantiaca]HCT57482.1 TlpA family protein disulfide reductase [Gemmatimonas aurantiaca]
MTDDPERLAASGGPPSDKAATDPSVRRRWPAWASWSNLVFAAVLLWAAPRCWPHVEALVGARAKERRQPSYAITTRAGGLLTPDSLRGRVVLVNIWATWCPPCRAEMPLLQQLAEAYASDSVVVLGLSVDRGPARTVDAFLAERGITYPVAIVSDEVVRAFGGVRGYPTSLLLDKQGVVRHTVMGPVGPVTLRPALRRLIAEPRDAASPPPRH